MNFRIREQKSKMMSKTKYLGLFLDENLSFKYHLDTVKLKLNRANCLQTAKLGIMLEHLYLEQYTLLFLVHVSDMNVKSGDRIKIMLLKTLKKIQSKTITILNFKDPRAETSTLYKE